MEENLKDLKRISWVCSEEEYRADPAYSYSILAKYNREGFNKLDSLFEEKKLETMMARERKRERDERKEKLKNNFILESRFELLKESLDRSKKGSEEFDAILRECINIILEMKELKDYFDENKIRTVIKYVKDKSLENEIIGEFDGKKNNTSDEKKWPHTGRITLREALPKDLIGQNKNVPYSEKVNKMFGSGIKNDNQPSPSSKEDKKEPKMEIIT